MADTSGSFTPLDDEPTIIDMPPEKKRTAAQRFAHKIKKTFYEKTQAPVERINDNVDKDQMEGLKQRTKDVSKGALVEAEKTRFQEMSLQVGQAATIVNTLGTSIAVEKLVGANLKEGLPISFKRHVLINCGQILSLTSDILGIIVPVIGEGAGAPITFAGASMTMKGQGFTSAQAGASALHATGTSVAAGAIPGAGTLFSITGFANDIRDFCTPVPKASKLQALEQMKKTQEKARALLKEIDKLSEEAPNPEISKRRDEIEKRLQVLEHYVQKYDAIIMKRLEKDKDGSKYLKYAEYLKEKGLDSLQSEVKFEEYLDLDDEGPTPDDRWVTLDDD